MAQKRFVICHKDVSADWMKDDPQDRYILVSNRDIKNESKYKMIYTDKSLDDRMWSELACFKTILDNTEEGDYICINHYRRLLECPDDVLSVATPVSNNRFNLDAYGYFHNANDILLLENIVRQKYFNASVDFTKMLTSYQLYPYNMVNFPRPLFKDYCDFLFTCLEEFARQIGVTDYESMQEHVKQYSHLYLKDFAPNNDIVYQSRLYAFLAERLTTVFIRYMMNKSDNVCYAYVWKLEKSMIM